MSDRTETSCPAIAQQVDQSFPEKEKTAWLSRRHSSDAARRERRIDKHGYLTQAKECRVPLRANELIR